MIRSIVAALAIAAACGAAAAAQGGSCDEMVAGFDAFLKSHPNATGALTQTVDAQRRHQPTRDSVEKAEKQGRAHLYDLLATAQKQQQAGDEAGCLSTLAEIKWMLQP
jgi:hypothetical protein